MQRYDVLRIQIAGKQIVQPVDSDILVERDGYINLGPTYGAVDVKGLDIKTVERKLVRRLKTVLVEPAVEVTPIARAGGYRYWPDNEQQ